MARRIFLICGLVGFGVILTAVVNQWGAPRFQIPSWAIILPIVGLFIAAEYSVYRPSNRFAVIMGVVGLGSLVLLPIVWYGAIETLAGKNAVISPIPMGRAK